MKVNSLDFLYSFWQQPLGTKNYLTNSTSPLIMKVKLFIYLRNLCSGLMTKKLNVFGVNHA
ncbi:MAG: hypothetical protein LBP77_02735, partial [Rickettsiales bacterium]|nr:hypothetical protein [Rickettsiales bacterium]